MPSDRENALTWFNREQTVSFMINQLRLKNQLKKLVEQGDTNITIIENEDGSIEGTIPLSYIKLCKPHTRNLSDDQRKAVSDRFKKAREDNNSTN